MKRNGGFTLIELIVVIAVLGILAMIAVPRFAGFTLAAKHSTDESNARMLTRLAHSIAAKEGDFPADLTDFNVPGEYLKETVITLHPDNQFVYVQSNGTVSVIPKTSYVSGDDSGASEPDTDDPTEDGDSESEETPTPPAPPSLAKVGGSNNHLIVNASQAGATIKVYKNGILLTTHTLTVTEISHSFNNLLKDNGSGTYTATVTMGGVESGTSGSLVVD